MSIINSLTSYFSNLKINKSNNKTSKLSKEDILDYLSQNKIEVTIEVYELNITRIKGTKIYILYLNTGLNEILESFTLKESLDKLAPLNLVNPKESLEYNDLSMIFAPKEYIQNRIIYKKIKEIKTTLDFNNKSKGWNRFAYKYTINGIYRSIQETDINISGLKIEQVDANKIGNYEENTIYFSSQFKCMCFAYDKKT